MIMKPFQISSKRWPLGDRAALHTKCTAAFLLAMSMAGSGLALRGGDLAFQTLREFKLPTAQPSGTLIQASDGRFYGTTVRYQGELFEVYQVTTDGLATTLARTERPLVGLLQGQDGNFYGGVADNLVRMTPDGQLTTFASFAEGDWPNSLILGRDGDLYGTTLNGGKD